MPKKGIGHKNSYLITEHEFSSSSTKVKIVDTFEEAVKNWTASTRLSPVYPLKHEADNLSPKDGVLQIIFCGPVNPENLTLNNPDIIPYITLGIFNILSLSFKQTATQTLCSELKKLSIPYEIWTVYDGKVSEIIYSANDLNSELPNSLIELATLKNIPEELRITASEYCTLMSACMCRANQAIPYFYSDLLKVHNFAVEVFKSVSVSSNESNKYTALGMMSHLNGALSRFCSQTLSGISPISKTECHFWIHSLLGTGIANIALQNFAKFVLEKMDDQNIPYRVNALASKTDDIPNLLKISPDFWHQNHLEKIEAPKSSQNDDYVPPLTYFSGRDGFRSSQNTLSAPLASLGACNTLQWSLRTVTHEISHMLVRPILSKIYPNPTTSTGLKTIGNFLEEKKPNTWLEAIQFYMLHTIVTMEQVSERSAQEKNSITEKWDEQLLADALLKWQHEVEEIIVHVFDFLFFYGQDSEKYIQSIWLTWGVIPNISSRTAEYVMRTLCATTVKHLRRSGTEEAAKDEVLRVFSKLMKDNPESVCIKQANDLLSKNPQWGNLRSELVARKNLVKIVRGFLYWDKAAQHLRGDPLSQSDSTEHGGYRFKNCQFSKKLAENPLRVIEEYTKSTTASDVSSVWLLYILAFNIKS